MQNYISKLWEIVEKFTLLKNQSFGNKEFERVETLAKEVLRRTFPSKKNIDIDFGWAGVSRVISVRRYSNEESQQRYLEEIDAKISFIQGQIDILSLDLPSIESSLWDIQIHPEIFTVVKSLFEDWHYFNAVENAYKIVRGKLQKITWEEQAHKAFSVDNMTLIFKDSAESEAEIDFREWVKYLNMAIQRFRNEKSHTLMHLEKNKAAHYIALASLSMYLIEAE